MVFQELLRILSFIEDRKCCVFLTQERKVVAHATGMFRVTSLWRGPGHMPPIFLPLRCALSCAEVTPRQLLSSGGKELDQPQRGKVLRKKREYFFQSVPVKYVRRVEMEHTWVINPLLELGVRINPPDSTTGISPKKRWLAKRIRLLAGRNYDHARWPYRPSISSSVWSFPFNIIVYKKLSCWPESDEKLK